MAYTVLVANNAGSSEHHCQTRKEALEKVRELLTVDQMSKIQIKVDESGRIFSPGELPALTTGVPVKNG